MRTLILTAVLLSTSVFAAGSHTVRPHMTKRGTYVQQHRQTNPDHSKANNWSTKGNVNPYTGKQGSER